MQEIGHGQEELVGFVRVERGDPEGADALQRERAPLQRWLALAGAVLGLLVTIPLYTNFDLQSAGLQFEEKRVWIETFNIENSCLR